MYFIYFQFLERGRVYVFGNNEWGQLGLGHTKASNKPSFIKGKVIIDCNQTYVHSISCRCTTLPMSEIPYEPNSSSIEGLLSYLAVARMERKYLEEGMHIVY